MFERPTACAASALVLSVAAPALASVTGLGFLPGGELQSNALDVSSDGSTVVGSSFGETGPLPFVWRAGHGIVPLADLAGGDMTGSANAVTPDGSVIVGNASSTPSAGTFMGEAARWSGGSVMGLGFLGLTGFNQSSALGVSADGSRVVGVSTNVGIFEAEATLWTDGVPMSLGWGELSSATAISADAGTIVGARPLPSGGFGVTFEPVAMRNGVTTAMDDLPGGSLFLDGAIALGVSGDGSRATGWATDFNGQVAAMWDADGNVTPLGTLGPGQTSLANAISDDGSTIVGASSDPFSGSQRAFLWTDGLGLVDLTAFTGADQLGWTLVDARGVSADGRFVVGTGINPDGDFEAFIVTVPSPGTAALPMIGAIGAVRRRR